MLLKLGGFVTSAKVSSTIPGASQEHSASPSVFGFSLDTLDRLWICPNIASCNDYHTLVSEFALDIRALCILGFVYHSQIESTRRWLRPWYSGACTLFSGFTHRIASRTDYQTLGSRRRYLGGASGTLGEGNSVMPPSGQKKISLCHKKTRKTWFGPLLSESISGQTWNGPRHGATPSWNPIYATAGRVAPSFTNRVMHRLSHPQLRLQFLYFLYLIFDIANWNFTFQQVVREKHHKSTAGPWFKND